MRDVAFMRGQSRWRARDGLDSMTTEIRGSIRKGRKEGRKADIASYSPRALLRHGSFRRLDSVQLSANPVHLCPSHSLSATSSTFTIRLEMIFSASATTHTHTLTPPPPTPSSSSSSSPTRCLKSTRRGKVDCRRSKTLPRSSRCCLLLCTRKAAATRLFPFLYSIQIEYQTDKAGFIIPTTGDDR